MERYVTSIWEGSGNVNCLNVLRAMAKEPEVVQAFFAEVTRAQGMDVRLDAAITRLKGELSNLADVEIRARRVVEQMALTLQGALLLVSFLKAHNYTSTA